jgi:hypothetical protein
MLNSHDMWNLIAKSLGLDAKKVCALDIHLALNSVVEVDVTFLPEPSEVEDFANVLTSKRFEGVAAIAIKCKRALTPQAREALVDSWKRVMERNPKLPPCLVLDGDMELEPIYERRGDG